MEGFNQMMNAMMDSFTQMQEKTQSFWTEAFKAPMKFTEDQMAILDNGIKFHKAAVEYHNSLVKMTEAIKDTGEILSKYRPK